MQTNGSTAPAAPATPLASDPGAIPTTSAQIASIRARRKELSSQLTNVSDRRGELAEQVKTASGAIKVGLEQRIGVLDKRIVQLESEMATTGFQLTNASALGGTTTVDPNEPRAFGIFSPGQFTGLSIVFTVLVLFPLAITAARLLWRRAKQPITVPAIQGDAAQRLERLEQSVEAVAIEVERISEGQRFVTRLLSAAPQAGILPTAQRDTVAVKISD